MKKVTKAIAAAGLAVMIGSGSAFAAEAPNAGSVGLGYQGVFGGDILQGVSARGWVSNDIALEGNFFYGNVDVTADGVPFDIFDGSLYLFTGKIAYAPVVNSNSRFYFGAEVGMGTVDVSEVIGSDPNEDTDVFVYGPLIGAEHYFSEFPEVGFNWEVQYQFHEIDSGPDDADDEDIHIDLNGIFVKVGAHYYF